MRPHHGVEGRLVAVLGKLVEEKHASQGATQHVESAVL